MRIFAVRTSDGYRIIHAVGPESACEIASTWHGLTGKVQYVRQLNWRNEDELYESDASKLIKLEWNSRGMTL